MAQDKDKKKDQQTLTGIIAILLFVVSFALGLIAMYV